MVMKAKAAAVVGWAPQRPAIYAHLSARENLELFGRLARLPDPGREAARTRERFGLPGGEQRAAELSVGNQQRLNLALAFLGNPDVLLLDEPSAALDPPQRRRFWELLLEHRQRGCSTLLATHSLEEAARLADRVLLLVEGAVAQEGSPAEVATALETL